MDHITVPKHCVCSGRYMSSHPKMSKRKQAALGEFGFTKRVCHFFFIKKISASDCSYIVLIFRAISASMFLLCLFLIKKKS